MRYLIQQCTRTFGVLLLAVVVFGFASTPAQAQMDVTPGVRAGVNFMTLGGDDVPSDVGSRTGFMIGGFLLVDLQGPLSLQPELNYIQKGASWDQSFQGTTVTTTRKLDYLEIPVLAKLQIPVTGPLSPNVFAGPTLGFNMNATMQAEGGGQSNSQDISDSISGTDFGLAIGAGTDFGLSAGTVSVDLRYGLGLSSVDDSGSDASVQNRGFMVTAGFAF